MPRVDYDRFAADYDKRFQADRLEGIARGLRPFARGRILEVGCGTGRWLREFPSAVGADLSLGMLRRARPPVVAADAVRLPFRADAFDFVYCVNALHFFSDRTAYFHEARRVARRDGVAAVVAIDPRHIETWFVYDLFEGARDIDLERYLPLEDIASRMSEAGFTDVTVEQVERSRFLWTRDETLASPLTTAEGNSLIALLPEASLRAGFERIRAASADTRFETDMPFFRIAGRVT
jgi:SAM-dependent methyltransferase